MRSMACPSPALAVPDLRLRAPDGLADAVDAGPALAPGPADVRAAGPGSAQGADTRPGPAWCSGRGYRRERSHCLASLARLFQRAAAWTPGIRASFLSCRDFRQPVPAGRRPVAAGGRPVGAGGRPVAW